MTGPTFQDRCGERDVIPARAIDGRAGLPSNTDRMEFIAIIVAGLVGWKNGTFNQRDLKMIALVVVGWSAVMAAAAVPYLTLESLVFSLLYHAAVVGVPYSVGALAKRVAERSR